MTAAHAWLTRSLTLTLTLTVCAAGCSSGPSPESQRTGVEVTSSDKKLTVWAPAGWTVGRTSASSPDKTGTVGVTTVRRAETTEQLQDSLGQRFGCSMKKDGLLPDDQAYLTCPPIEQVPAASYMIMLTRGTTSYWLTVASTAGRLDDVKGPFVTAVTSARWND